MKNLLNLLPETEYEDFLEELYGAIRDKLTALYDAGRNLGVSYFIGDLPTYPVLDKIYKSVVRRENRIEKWGERVRRLEDELEDARAAYSACVRLRDNYEKKMLDDPQYQAYLRVRELPKNTTFSNLKAELARKEGERNLSPQLSSLNKSAIWYPMLKIVTNCRMEDIPFVKTRTQLIDLAKNRFLAQHLPLRKHWEE